MSTFVGFHVKKRSIFEEFCAKPKKRPIAKNTTNILQIYHKYTTNIPQKYYKMWYCITKMWYCTTKMWYCTTKGVVYYKM